MVYEIGERTEEDGNGLRRREEAGDKLGHGIDVDFFFFCLEVENSEGSDEGLELREKLRKTDNIIMDESLLEENARNV